MRRSKQTFLFLSQKDSNLTRNFLAEKQCFYVFWARDGVGLGLLGYMGLSEVFTVPKGMVFELFMSEKGVNFVLCFHVTSSFSKTKNYESFSSSSFIRCKNL